MIIILFLGTLLFIWGVWPFLLRLYLSPFSSSTIYDESIDIIVKEESRRYIYVDVYWVIVKYSYDVGGKVYSSNNVGISDGLKFQSEEKAKKFVDEVKQYNSCLYSERFNNKAFLTTRVSNGDGDSTFSKIASGIIILIFYFYLDFYF